MSIKEVIPPDNISWESWAASVILRSAPTNIPPPYPEERWADWAIDMLQCEPYAVLKPFTTPPSTQATWKEWARHFNSLVIEVLPPQVSP